MKLYWEQIATVVIALKKNLSVRSLETSNKNTQVLHSNVLLLVIKYIIGRDLNQLHILLVIKYVIGRNLNQLHILLVIKYIIGRNLNQLHILLVIKYIIGRNLNQFTYIIGH